MSRRVFSTILIILIVIITAIILDHYQPQSNQTSQHAQQIVVTPTLPPSVPQTVLQLFPNPALPDSQGNVTIDVSMNTHNNRVTATQFMITYDPTILRFISIKPDDAFYNAKVVKQDINETTGTILYKMEIPAQLTYNQVSGNYDIADIKFATKQKGITSVKILSASVTSPDNKNSVLKSTANTTVNLNE